MVRVATEQFWQPGDALLSTAQSIVGFALDGWTVNRIRDDGAIDAYVPLHHIEVSNVPIDPRNVDRLVKLFDEHAANVGGTGQRDPVVIGHVATMGLFMVDGFHRHETQRRRGHSHLHSTVEPNLTFDQIVKRRLEYAHAHPEVEFARQVDWVQSVWDLTPWSRLIPNVLTAFRALKEDYAYDHTEDVELINSLDDATYDAIRTWVTQKSSEWGYSPVEIRENLAKVESFDPELMPLVYQKKGIPPRGRISLSHVEVITNTYPGEFDMQQAVVDLITQHGLTSAQTEAMIQQVENGNPFNAQDIERLAHGIDFARLKTTRRSVRTASRGSREVGESDEAVLHPRDIISNEHFNPHEHKGKLTQAELQILKFASEGRTTIEIAEQLAYSESTIKGRLASVYSKLGAADKTVAVLRAIQMGDLIVDHMTTTAADTSIEMPSLSTQSPIEQHLENFAAMLEDLATAQRLCISLQEVRGLITTFKRYSEIRGKITRLEPLLRTVVERAQHPET